MTFNVNRRDFFFLFDFLYNVRRYNCVVTVPREHPEMSYFGHLSSLPTVRYKRQRYSIGENITAGRFVVARPRKRNRVSSITNHGL